MHLNKEVMKTCTQEAYICYTEQWRKEQKDNYLIGYIVFLSAIVSNRVVLLCVFSSLLVSVTFAGPCISIIEMIRFVETFLLTFCCFLGFV